MVYKNVGVQNLLNNVRATRQENVDCSQPFRKRGAYHVGMLPFYENVLGKVRIFISNQ